MEQRRFNSGSMGLAEATAHLAALTALSWLLQHIRAREALGVVDDRLAAGGGAGRVAARSVMPVHSLALQQASRACWMDVPLASLACSTVAEPDSLGCSALRRALRAHSMAARRASLRLEIGGRNSRSSA